MSVIIPVCNDAERLEVCLRALEAQTYPTATYEIIVVDNGSAASIEPVVARYAHARACFEQHPGSYAARNKGLSLARGEVIAFTDSDCIPTPDWLERGVTKLLGDPTCGMIGGRIDVFCRTPGRPTSAELYDCTRGLLQRKYIEVRGFGATANVFTRRRILDAVGTFDATLKSCGDVEWGHRVAAAGYRLVYADDTRVAHPARHSLGGIFRKMVRVAGGLHALRVTGWTDAAPTTAGVKRDTPWSEF